MPVHCIEKVQLTIHSTLMNPMNAMLNQKPIIKSTKMGKSNFPFRSQAGGHYWVGGWVGGVLLGGDRIGFLGV